jgi:predicted CXXCH cytochrome family protein
MSRVSHLLRRCIPLLGTLVFAALLGPPANLSSAAATRSKPTSESTTCTSADCHAAVLKHKVMHGPAAQERCLDCHTYADASKHQFKRFAAPDEGCPRCHVMAKAAVMHAPVTEGKCTACHDPHGSEHAKLLIAEPGKGLCAGCHKDAAFSQKKFVHKPAAQGDCGTCHEAHGSAQGNLLKKPAFELCTGCHPTAVPKLGEAMSTHAPARENCMGCHDPHASNVDHQLKQSPPDLCLSCHKSFAEKLAASTVTHGAMTQGGSCANCHAPHFSKLAKLEKMPQPQQCLEGCHDRAVKTGKGETLANMAALLKDNPQQHGPIRLGACTACHEPHAGKEARLLSAAYPPEFYAPFEADRYKLCFTCHSKDLVLQPENAPTGFADGKKNLHWVHVNQEKGRTCRACHEVHASKHPFQIRDSVPFGPSGWTLAIKFQPAAKGGSCSPGCHVPRSYDHGDRPKSIPFVALTPKAQALVKPPPPPNPLASTVAESKGGIFPVSPPPFTPGVFPCTGCHDPNRAVNTQRRVVQKPHQDIVLKHDEEHRWCLDCHNAQNRDVLRSASGDPIPFSESYRLCGQCHGLQYRDWKSGVHGKRTGQWDGRKEYLLCVNCHNPHSPKFKALKPLPPPVRPNTAKHEVR